VRKINTPPATSFYFRALMHAYQVSTLVNRATVDQPQLIEPERERERS
jgi:hypothetical protein